MSIDTWESKSLVLGLGNPGTEYEGTRHNRGREVVEELARRRGVTLRLGHCQTRLAIDGELVLATPETFMNRSGYAARCLIERYGLDPARMLVVFDDIYLPLGALRLRTGGGAGRAEGDGLGARVPAHPGDRPAAARHRARSSRRRPRISTASDFVLARLRARARRRSRASRSPARADACETWLAAGAAEAMNRFNRDRGR